MQKWEEKKKNDLHYWWGGEETPWLGLQNMQIYKRIHTNNSKQEEKHAKHFLKTTSFFAKDILEDWIGHDFLDMRLLLFALVEQKAFILK